MNTMKAIATVFATAALFSGPGVAQTYRYDAPPANTQANSANFGVIDAIEPARAGDERGSNVAGTILGAVVGGVIGHQIGSGRGNDVATVAGALGGAAVGHEISETRGGRSGYNVAVRLDSGGRQSFWRDDVTSLAVGDRVQVDNDRLIRLAGDANRHDDRRYSQDRPYSEDRRYDSDQRRGPDVFRYDANGNRVAEDPGVRYAPASGQNLASTRVYHYDSQGYRVDQYGNRYDEEGYWVDERGIRHEYQDPPLR